MSSDSQQPGYPIDRRGTAMTARSAAGVYGDFEAAAGRILARATGASVVLQDDNRIDRTPDIRVDYLDGRVGICEVVTISDPHRAEQTAAFARGELTFTDQRLRRKWWVTLAPNADRRRLRSDLVAVLLQMEADGETFPTHQPLLDQTASTAVLHALGVEEVSCDQGDAKGQVIGYVRGIEGHLELDWSAFHSWLTSVLGSDLMERKKAKLLEARGDERHLFVGVSWSEPWAVQRALDREEQALPPVSPGLPEGITHLWLFGCEFPGRAIAWWPGRGWVDVRAHWKTE